MTSSTALLVDDTVVSGGENPGRSCSDGRSGQAEGVTKGRDNTGV
jgi:hypothetical protein